MKGTIIRHSRKGNPVLQPDEGDKEVVLFGYETRPEVGDTVNYTITKEGRYNDQGRLADQTETTQHQETTSIDCMLTGIKILWERSFAQHMDLGAREAFPQSLQTIKEAYRRGDYETAAAEAHDNYQWASSRTEACELSPIGFEYFPMRDRFRELERVIRTELSK